MGDFQGPTVNLPEVTMVIVILLMILFLCEKMMINSQNPVGSKPMWAPPATICERWLRFAPVATVISTINHSEIGVM